MVRYTYNISISEESLRRKNKVGGIWVFVVGKLFWGVRWSGQRESYWRRLLSRGLKDRGKCCASRQKERGCRGLGTSDLQRKSKQEGVECEREQQQVMLERPCGCVCGGVTGHSGSWNWMSLGWMRGGRHAAGSLWLLCLMVCGAIFFFLFY